MPRKHRRRDERPIRDVTHLANGGARRETRRGRSWFVREVSAARATKIYRCPLCANEIPEGQGHVVAWNADDFFGDDAAVASRRHYHAHCWRIG